MDRITVRQVPTAGILRGFRACARRDVFARGAGVDQRVRERVLSRNRRVNVDVGCFFPELDHDGGPDGHEGLQVLQDPGLVCLEEFGQGQGGEFAARGVADQPSGTNR